MNMPDRKLNNSIVQLNLTRSEPVVGVNKNAGCTTGSGTTEIPWILHRKFHVQYIEIPCILFGSG
jgi:hypothetical protein